MSEFLRKTLGAGAATAIVFGGPAEAVLAAEEQPEPTMTLQECGPDTQIEAEGGLTVIFPGVVGSTVELGVFKLPDSELDPCDAGFSWYTHKESQYPQAQVGTVAEGTGKLVVDLANLGPEQELECGDVIQTDVTKPGTFEVVGEELVEAEADEATVSGNNLGGDTFKVVCIDTNINTGNSENGSTESLAKTGGNYKNLAMFAAVLVTIGTALMAGSKKLGNGFRSLKQGIRKIAKNYGLAGSSY